MGNASSFQVSAMDNVWELISSCEEGTEEKVCQILKLDLSYNQIRYYTRGSCKGTFLHHAVTSKRYKIVTVLLELCPELVHISNSQDRIPLIEAIRIRDKQMVDLLISVDPTQLERQYNRDTKHTFNVTPFTYPEWYQLPMFEDALSKIQEYRAIRRKDLANMPVVKDLQEQISQLQKQVQWLQEKVEKIT